MRNSAARRGLTLIELLVVVALLGFVAATVTVRLNGRLGQAMLTQAVAQWEFTDSQLRSHASRNGTPLTLHLEIGTSELRFAFDPDDESAKTTRSLGRGMKVSRLQTSTREITYGPATIEYSGQGSSDTYVVELSGSRGVRRLLVAGVTGQVSEFANAEEVDELLTKLLPASVHAD